MPKVTIDTTPLTRAVQSVRQNASRSLPFMKVWGAAVASEATLLASQKQKKSGHFWSDVAQSVRLKSVTEVNVELEGDYRGAHKETGGEIRAKNKRALTIPLPSAKGKDAAWWAAKTGGLFRLPGSRLLGYTVGKGKAQRFKLLFILVKRVDQPAQPWWPSEARAAELADDAAEALSGAL